MLFRKHISKVAKLVLGVLLFAQAALALAGCDFGQRSPAQAIAAVAEMPCPDHGAPDVLDGNANLCLAHCTSDAQNVDTAGLTFPALSTVVVPTVPSAPAPGRFVLRRPSSTDCAFAAPPLSILFQNFRV